MKYESFKQFLNETPKKQSAKDGMDGIRKRMNKKSPKGRHYGHAPGETGAGSGMSIGESDVSLIHEILSGASPFIGRDYRNSAQLTKGYEYDYPGGYEENEEDFGDEESDESANELELVDDDEMGAAEGDDAGDEADERGIIRTVKNAHLVKKEKTEDGKFEELWIYNVGKDMKNSLQTRKNILSGTDIASNKLRSEDGEQSYDLWTIGNVQMLHIKGLAN